MENVHYCYIDIFNVRMKGFFDRKKFEVVKANPKGGLLEIYFKQLPENTPIVPPTAIEIEVKGGSTDIDSDDIDSGKHVTLDNKQIETPKKKGGKKK